MKYRHQDVAILRQALAYIAKTSSQGTRGVAIAALGGFAARISDYCEHPQNSDLGNKMKCLNCGFEVKKL